MEIKPILKGIPQNPGCYIYRDKTGKIIYIGKAKNLKKRVSSYFNKTGHDAKTLALVGQIVSVDYIVTNSEVEALLLENNLIKKNKPKYNIDLKDSKSYAFIELTKEEFPRLLVARTEIVKKIKSEGKLFGPFISAQTRDYVLNTLNKTFKLRTCKRLPKKKCIRYDIGLCSAPCIGVTSKSKYEKDVESAKMVLSGKTGELIQKLKSKMESFSKDQDFENALIIREQISAMQFLKEKQSVERNKKYNEDIINYLVKEDKIYLMLFNVNKGILENKQTFEFEYKPNFFEEFLVQYYSENKPPKVIILPENVEESIKDFLEHQRKSSVQITVPKIGELNDLLKLVMKNIEIQFFGDVEKIEELRKKLNLQDLPKVMECFDISHLGGTEVVASMVQFRNGKPDKTNYRKFKIKGPEKNDDFAAMNEVVIRRYSRLKKEGKDFPDLIVIDGGLGQLNAAINSLKEIDVKIPIISLAKKFEEVYVPGKEIPIRFDRKNKARLLLEAIRDEAHRFAVTFQRQRRSKRIFKNS